ncbi:hypothetical protein D3C72_1566790 [compost metagenome]
MAVFRDVVAREQGKGGQPTFQTQAQRFHQDPRHGGRLAGIRQIGADRLMLKIQFSTAGFNAIAFFGNGHRDNRHLWLRQLFQYGANPFQLAVYALMHRTDHDSLITRRAFFQHAVKMVLLAQRPEQIITAEQADFADPPVAALTIQHSIGQ